MNTKERTQEQISALIDGELTDSQIEIALAALRDADCRKDWNTYHHIGDVLRSEDMGFALSAGFSARMAARLDAEPTIVAPVIRPQEKEAVQTVAVQGSGKARIIKRLAVPGVAAAAVATMMFVSAPQMLVARKGGASGTGGAPIIMVSNRAEPAMPAAVPAAEVKTASTEQQDAVMLRDPQIDEYLLAHQRFSPSVFSTAQYARSATFASDSGK